MRRTCMRGGWFMAAAGLLLTAGEVEAQFPLTFVAGPTFTSISSDEFDTSTKTGFFASVGTSFALNEQFAFQPFVGYVQKGAEFEGTSSGEDTYNYIEIVGLFGTGFPLSESVNLIVSAGPQVSFNIECTESVPDLPDEDCKDFTDYTGGTDFGLVGNAGLQFPVGGSTLGFGGGIDYGLSDIFENIDGGYKNRGYYLWVAYGVVLGDG